MATTKYKGVFIDSKGQIFYETTLGVDQVTGKKIRKKSRFDENGIKFKTVTDAYKELTRIKREYHIANSYYNYNITYQEFLNTVYISYYKTSVKESTFNSRTSSFKILSEQFGNKELRNITLNDVHRFRTNLLLNYSQDYASLVFGIFRKSLDKAVQLKYLQNNISKELDAIPKEKIYVPYWTKEEFEQVISFIYILMTSMSICALWFYGFII